MASTKVRKTQSQLQIQSVRDDHSSSPDSSLDDQNRKELLWESREEALLLDIQNKCKESAAHHTKTGKRKKLWYTLCGVPATILPLVTATLTQMGVAMDTITCLVLVSGILTGVNTFFNFGKQRQCHFDHAGKYDELSMDIGLELCKPKRNRVACDVFLYACSSRFNNINGTAPV